MPQVLSCQTTDKLCIEYDEVKVNQPITVYWPVGLVPEISDLSKLRIFLFQSDLLRNPQSDPCNIAGLNALTSWTPLIVDPQNTKFPLLKSTIISIPPLPNILSAISADNHFFLQIKSVDNRLCSIGPYSIPSPFTSFKIDSSNNLSNSGTNTVGSTDGTSTVVITDGSNGTITIPTMEVDPTSTSNPTSNSSSLFESKSLQIGMGVGIGLIAILILILAWILKRKVNSDEQKTRSLQFREDMSNLSITLGSNFAQSTEKLISQDVIKPPQDPHQVVVIENSTDIIESGSRASIIERD